MANRDVSIALGGAVVGLMIGAITFSSAQSLALAAYVPDWITWGETDLQVVPRSEILRRPANTTDGSEIPVTAPLTDRTREVLEQPDRPGEEDIAASPACMLASEISAAFLRAIDANIPVNIENAVMRANLRDTATSFVQRECTSAVPVTGTPAADSEEASAPVNNNCEKYPTTSIRYFLCMAEQQAGRVYPPEK